MGFQNASTINKATMLYLIYKGIEGGFEYIGVDSDNPTLEQMESAVQDMAENIGISPKQLLDWEFTVWQ